MSVRAERAALREDAAMLLAEMGGTPSEVAVFLTSMGVPPGSGADDSAAVRYLQAVMGSDSRITQVKVTTRRLMLTTEWRWRSTVRLGLPDAVREFVASVGPPSPDRAREVPSE